MDLVLLGVNHKTASIGLRERLAIAPGELAEATRSLLASPGIREGMILSTCNRVELLTFQDASAPHLGNFLEGYFGIEPELLQPHLYEYREGDAVRHLFRVAASLDSMVIGEPQILGQVKDAYRAAQQAGASRAHLDRLLQRTFAVAKRVRTETEIGSSPVSIASVAVELAQKIFGSLAGKKVFLVGAGKMSELAARHLMKQGADAVFVTNRTHSRAERLAGQFGGQAIRFEDLHQTVDQADIVITSTGAPHAIFRREHALEFLHRRRQRPMVFVDIAVPRDVDPEINRLEGIFLYDIDDLQTVAASHMAERGKSAEAAEAMVAAEAEAYQRRAQALNAVPAILDLQRSVETLRQGELRRMQARLEPLTDAQLAAVEALTHGIANKFLHHPLQAIKAAAREGDAAAIEAILNAFGFNREGQCGLGQNVRHEEKEDDGGE